MKSTTKRGTKKIPVPAVTPGGSIVYEVGKLKKPKVGVLSTSYAEEREAIYEELWGEASSVSHELLPQIPHVDVYTSPPRSRIAPSSVW